MNSATNPIPLVNATPGPLASVLHLLELADRDGTECEELRALLAEPRAANGGCQHTPVMIAYGSRASNGTPMIAVGGVSVWCCGVVGFGYREVRSSQLAARSVGRR